MKELCDVKVDEPVKTKILELTGIFKKYLNDYFKGKELIGYVYNYYVDGFKNQTCIKDYRDGIRAIEFFERMINRQLKEGK